MSDDNQCNIKFGKQTMISKDVMVGLAAKNRANSVALFAFKLP